MKFNSAIITATAIITLGTSCSGVKELSEQSATQLNAYTEGSLSYQSQHRFKFLFLESQRLKALEEFEKARTMMGQCLAIDPLNADAHYEMAQLYIRGENIQDALFHAEQSKILNPQNTWTLELLSQLYYAIGDREGQLEICKDLVTLEPSNVEYQYRLASTYTELGEYKKALDVYNEVQQKIGLNEELSIVKEHLYIQMGNIQMAAFELKALIAAFPNEIRYQKMLAELYHANDLTEESVKIYKDILLKNPTDSHANSALAEYFRLKKNYLKAFEYLTLSFDDPEFNLDVMLQVLSSYLELALQDEQYAIPLESLLKKALLNHPEQSVFHVLSGDYSFQKNETKKAYNAYEKALYLGLSEFSVWNRYLILGLELEEYVKTSSKGMKSIELHPIQPTLYLFTGLALSMNGEKEKAINLWNKGLNYVVNNRPLKSEFYNSLGDTYHSLGNYIESDNNYEKSLVLSADNPVALNNYSYYLSLRSKDLEKALSLSKKCNELMPDQPTYQDTYGWILYKLGRFSEAEKWLKKAAEGESNNAVILEHYGDVLFRLNRSKEALEYWERAQKAGGLSDTLNQKIQEGVLYE